MRLQTARMGHQRGDFVNIRRGIFCCLIVLFLFMTACEPSTKLEIKNDTSQSLEVWLSATTVHHIQAWGEGYSLGTVDPGLVLKKDISPDYPVYLFEGKDKTGNVVYSRYSTRDEMVRAKWKMVISPETGS